MLRRWQDIARVPIEGHAIISRRLLDTAEVRCPRSSSPGIYGARRVAFAAISLGERLGRCEAEGRATLMRSAALRFLGALCLLGFLGWIEISHLHAQC